LPRSNVERKKTIAAQKSVAGKRSYGEPDLTSVDLRGAIGY
jgi:hypothetical protein